MRLLLGRLTRRGSPEQLADGDGVLAEDGVCQLGFAEEEVVGGVFEAGQDALRQPGRWFEHGAEGGGAGARGEK